MIRFDHVTFGYEAERPVLRELSLEIPEGGRVCLTGASGQGKTTALRLLLGLEQPQSLDGTSQLLQFLGAKNPAGLIGIG